MASDYTTVAQRSKPSPPRIDVIIATRDRGPAIRSALSSIQASSVKDWRLMIVDQSTGDETEATVREAAATDSRIAYQRSQTTGLSVARNIALMQTAAPYIAVTDDDCEVSPDWLARIIAIFDEDPEAGCIGGTLDPAPFEPGTGDIPHFCPAERQRISRAWPHVEVFGANIALRRAALDTAGLFDEHLGSGARFPCLEEQDLCHRIMLAGYYLRVEPDVRVLHHGFRSNEQLRRLWERDGRGFGGLMAKAVRCGTPRAALTLCQFWGQWTGMVARRLVRGERPLKARQASVYIFSSMRGFVAGMRYPVAANRRVFAPQRWLGATHAGDRPAVALARRSS